MQNEPLSSIDPTQITSDPAPAAATTVDPVPEPEPNPVVTETAPLEAAETYVTEKRFNEVVDALGKLAEQMNMQNSHMSKISRQIEGINTDSADEMLNMEAIEQRLQTVMDYNGLRLPPIDRAKTKFAGPGRPLPKPAEAA